MTNMSVVCLWYLTWERQRLGLLSGLFLVLSSISSVSEKYTYVCVTVYTCILVRPVITLAKTQYSTFQKYKVSSLNRTFKAVTQILPCTSLPAAANCVDFTFFLTLLTVSGEGEIIPRDSELLFSPEGSSCFSSTYTMAVTGSGGRESDYLYIYT